MDLKCSIIHKHFFFFFFCCNTCSFPKYSVVKKNNYHAEAKSEEDKSPCCWSGGGLCLVLATQCLQCPGHRQPIVPICAEISAALFTQIVIWVVVWVHVAVSLAALHSCTNSSLVFPSFFDRSSDNHCNLLDRNCFPGGQGVPPRAHIPFISLLSIPFLPLYSFFLLDP